MDDRIFSYLLKKTRPCIKKKDTIGLMRSEITTEHKLVAMLKCLATGSILEDIQFSSIISK